MLGCACTETIGNGGTGGAASQALRTRVELLVVAAAVVFSFVSAEASAAPFCPARLADSAFNFASRDGAAAGVIPRVADEPLFAPRTDFGGGTTCSVMVRPVAVRAE